MMNGMATGSGIKLKISRSSFDGNAVQENGLGGGVAVASLDLELENVLFDANMVRRLPCCLFA